jgi:hypothetical protein
MLTKVEVRTTLGMLLVLTLDDITDGYAVESIEGLGPVKASLVWSNFAQLDGAQYQSSRRETRNVILTLGLEPDYVDVSVRDLRTNLYTFFMPKSQVELRFFDSSGLTVNAQARIETFDSVFFVREPQIVISMICFDPDFLELTPIVVEGETVADTTEMLVPYAGTVETGINFVLSLDRDLDDFVIYHRGPDDITRTLSFSGELLDDDVLTINTVTGSKGAILTRASVDTSVLYGVSSDSIWIELLPGDNYIRVLASGAPVPYTITYTPRHGGL